MRKDTWRKFIAQGAFESSSSRRVPYVARQWISVLSFVLDDIARNPDWQVKLLLQDESRIKRLAMVVFCGLQHTIGWLHVPFFMMRLQSRVSILSSNTVAFHSTQLLSGVYSITPSHDVGSENMLQTSVSISAALGCNEDIHQQKVLYSKARMRSRANAFKSNTYHNEHT